MDNQLLDDINPKISSANKPRRAIMYVALMVISFVIRNIYFTPLAMRYTKVIVLYTITSLVGFILVGALTELIRYLYRSITKKNQKENLWFEIIESAFSLWILFYGAMAVLFVVRFLFFPEL